MKQNLIAPVVQRASPLLLGALLLSAAFSSSAADPSPPPLMSYQGYLTDANGVPLGTLPSVKPRNYEVNFRIWNHATSTAPAARKWSESQIVTVDNGYFSTVLGLGTALSGEERPTSFATVFQDSDSSDRFVEIQVREVGAGSFLTITPRQRLLPSPASFLANKARQLDASNSSTNSLNNQLLHLEAADNFTSGLGYATSFGGATLNGPKLFGNASGVLGTVALDGTEKVALKWELNAGNARVAINKSGPANAELDVFGTVKATTFEGSGAGLTSLQANRITGDISDENLSANVPLKDAANTFSANQVINGRLGVNVASPGVPLHVFGGANAGLASGGDIVVGSLTGANLVIDNNEIAARNNSSAARLYLNSDGGTIQMGDTGLTTTPTLEIYGNDLSASQWAVKVRNSVHTAHVGGIRLSDDGFFELTNEADVGSPSFARLSSTGGWTAVSDKRLKKDIVSLTGMLDGALRLRPVEFHFEKQAADEPLQIGFIAQEVQKHFPSLVSEGEFLTLNYAGLSVVAIGAIQELFGKVSKMEGEVAELKKALAEVRDQEKRLSRLEDLEKRLSSLSRTQVADNR